MGEVLWPARLPATSTRKAGSLCSSTLQQWEVKPPPPGGGGGEGGATARSPHSHTHPTPTDPQLYLSHMHGPQGGQYKLSIYW